MGLDVILNTVYDRLVFDNNEHTVGDQYYLQTSYLSTLFDGNTTYVENYDTHAIIKDLLLGTSAVIPK